MTPDHIDALSTDAGATLAAIENDSDTVTLDEHMTCIKRMWELEDDGFITPEKYLTIPDCE